MAYVGVGERLYSYAQLGKDCKEGADPSEKGGGHLDAVLGLKLVCS